MPFVWVQDISPGAVVTSAGTAEIRTNVDYVEDNKCAADDVTVHASFNSGVDAGDNIGYDGTDRASVDSDDKIGYDAGYNSTVLNSECPGYDATYNGYVKAEHRISV